MSCGYVSSVVTCRGVSHVDGSPPFKTHSWQELEHDFGSNGTVPNSEFDDIDRGLCHAEVGFHDVGLYRRRMRGISQHDG